MRFLRCVHAEWALVAPRFTRTRLGISLIALGLSLIWLGSRGLDPVTVALLSGALGAIIAASTIVAGEEHRAEFADALTHPTTALAIASGRWLATIIPAVLLTTICSVLVGGPLDGALAGIAAAVAVGGCAVAAVVLLGNSAALALFLFMAVAGTIPPERLVDLARPGPLRLAAASALELGPALWHYRDIPTGDWGAILHAFAWAGLGLVLASAGIARRRSK